MNHYDELFSLIEMKANILQQRCPFLKPYGKRTFITISEKEKKINTNKLTKQNKTFLLNRISILVVKSK